MSRSRLSSALLVCGCILARPGLSAAAPQPGAVSQPAATPAASDAQEDVKTLVNSADARSVAVFRCSSADAGCPLKAETTATLESRFDDALLTGTGAPTPLIQALTALLDTSTVNADAVWPSSAKYLILHLVKFAAGNESPRDRWLLFTRGRRGVTASSGTRILGASRVAVAFIHLNVEVQLTPVGKPARTAPQAAADFYANVEYRAIAKSKLPINIQHLIGLLRLATKGQAEADVTPQPVGVLGFGLYTDIPVPSDVTVFGVRLGNVPVGFGKPNTYDNEGKYFWDASVAVPINKITLLTYDETETTFTPKVLNKQSIYGTINIYPFPVDLKQGSLRWLVPRAMVGLGLTGRPGENFLLAGAFGVKQLQFFVGSGFANHRVLKPGADPANGANYTQRYASRLTYGINVPVVEALKKLADATSKK